MKNLKILSFLIMLSVVLMSSTCERADTADNRDSIQQEAMAKELNAQTGLPAVANATMKKQLKMIIEECDKPNLVCYAYTYSQLTGKYTYFGKCIGYGVPYATQYTNPEKIAATFQGGYAILPQADPDGLFQPSSSDATWLMMINPNNPENIRPVYVEPTIIVSPFKLL